MVRASLRITICAAFLGIGWMTARAQTSEPDFVIVVNAPEGETTIECLRGCSLSWVERGLNPRSSAMRAFSFECSGAGVTRCSSARVGGWIAP